VLDTAAQAVVLLHSAIGTCMEQKRPVSGFDAWLRRRLKCRYTTAPRLELNKSSANAQ
jgi:hypothetical protein